MGDICEHEKLIEQYLRENDKKAAVQLLVKLIIKSAREKNFEQAEGLRDKLFEVDAMAVNEIVKTGEVIEAEKGDTIDKDHLSIWADLYNSLTAEETNALFYAMKLVKHPANQMIHKQGEMRRRLYFIDEGRLKMFFRQADKAILLKTLEPGDIFGEETFFLSNAFCTTSVITDSPVALHVLLRDDLNKLNSKTPGLESKLADYCSTVEPVAELLKAKKMERRVDQRLNLPGKILVQMLNDSDLTAVEPFRAELLDISASGLAFLMKTTQKVSTMLLGRDLTLKLTFDELATDLTIDCVGSVVAVNSEPFHEYAVHVEFGKNLASSIIDDLEDLVNNPAED